MRRNFIGKAFILVSLSASPVFADWDIEALEGGDGGLPAYLSNENIGTVNVDGSPRLQDDTDIASPSPSTELVVKGEETEVDDQVGGFQSPGNIGTGVGGITLPLGGSGTDVKQSAVARDREARRKIAQYQAVVDELEFEYGPYHSALREALADLALAYEEAGDYNASHELYDRALHATRINAGLHSLEQGPILKELIDSLLDVGDVEEAIERQRYYYWIHTRAYEEDPKKLLPVVSDLIEWHWWAYGQGIGDAPFEHLLDAYTLARESEEIIESEFGDHSNELLRILHVMNVIDYQLYTMNIPVRESALRSYERGVPTTAVASPNDVFSFGAYDQQTGMMGPEAFMRRGRKRFERMVEAVTAEYGAGSREYFELHVRNVDWKLLFGKDRTAVREYTEIYEEMVAGEEPVEFADELFDHVRRLPIMTDPVPAEGEELDEWTGPATAPPEDDEIPYIHVLFDVTPRGRVRNVRMEDTNIAAPDALFFRVRRELIDNVYRPRVQDGQVVTSLDVSRFIEFPKGGIRLGRATAESDENSDEIPEQDALDQAEISDSAEASVAEAGDN